MGGKSSSAPPSVSASDTSSSDSYLPMMLALLTQQQNQANNIPTSPDIPEMPTIATATNGPVDWTKKQEELKEKVKANFIADQKTKKGISSTVHTSPLVDDEDNSRPVGSTILGGS